VPGCAVHQVAVNAVSAVRPTEAAAGSRSIHGQDADGSRTAAAATAAYPSKNATEATVNRSPWQGAHDELHGHDKANTANPAANSVQAVTVSALAEVGSIRQVSCHTDPTRNRVSRCSSMQRRQTARSMSSGWPARTRTGGSAGRLDPANACALSGCRHKAAASAATSMCPASRGWSSMRSSSASQSSRASLASARRSPLAVKEARSSGWINRVNSGRNGSVSSTHRVLAR
jgi:hypothetical protein